MIGTPIDCAAGLFGGWYSVMMGEGLWILGVYNMRMVTIAMTDRAQPSGHYCGINMLLLNELRCVCGRASVFRRDQECGEGDIEAH